MWNNPASRYLLAATAMACTELACAPAPPPHAASPQVSTTEINMTHAQGIVDFWREAGPSMWFAKDAEFDRRFRERFAPHYAAATSGQLDDWLRTPISALALCILLDQYPRNSFRNTPRMYASDDQARVAADRAIRAGHDRAVDPQLAIFFYLPFGHSENIRDQERSVELTRRLGPEQLRHAEHHRDIIRRFGRFPHRNPILGRDMRPEEREYLDQGGFKG